MDAPSQTGRNRDELLDEAVVAFLEAVESGQSPNIQEWLARYPEVADELAEFFADQAKVERWTEPLRGGKGSTAPDDPEQTWGPGDTLCDPRGAALNDYELLHEIACGGMGVVYKARQTSLNRIVALKMIRAGRLASAAEMQRFRREAEAAASLDHPHIVPIYEVGEHKGRPYFSMKFIEGGSLAAHLNRFANDQPATARFMAAVARAVHHAHQRGVLHRDLKPGNILLDRQGQPWVTDFGLAGRLEGDSGITQSGAIVGTPSYMAPEQAAGQKNLTTAADVFSLGAILYALAAGQPPFQADTPLETVRRVLVEEPRRPRLLNPRLDRDLETICLKCLQKEPQRRYGSAEALAEDLERWLAGEPILARRTSVWERTWKRAKRNPAAAALAAVFAIAVLVMLAGGISYLDQRARVAEQELKEHRRVTQIGWDAQELVSEAEIGAAREDWQAAKSLLEKALAKAGDEPALRDLALRAMDLLRETNRRLAEQEARLVAQRKHRQFFQHRDEAIFYGTLFTGLDAPTHVAATRRAAEQGLRLFGLTREGDGSRSPDDFRLDDKQKDEVSAGCYELLLILAEAEVQHDATQVALALRLLDRAARFGPPTKAYHLRRARYLEALGDRAGAAAENQLAASLEAVTALDHFLLGDDLRRQGDLPGAIRALQRVVQVQPDHFWGHYLLALCYLPSQQNAARAHLAVCASQRPDFAWSYFLRGIAHGHLDEFEAAEEDFQSALKHAPEEASLREELRYGVFVNRAILHLRQERFPEAIDDLREAVAIAPDKYHAYGHLADAYRQMHHADAAIEQLGKAIDTTKRLPNVRGSEPAVLALLYYHRARLHDEQQDTDAALQDLESAHEAAPLAESHALQGRILYRRKQYREAVTAYDRALQAPLAIPHELTRAKIHHQRAEALLQLEDYQKAMRSLDRAVEESERPDAQVYQLRGLTRAKLADYSGAVSDYTQALAIRPDDSLTYAYRGRAYLVQAAYEPAWDDFEKAIALDPDNEDAVYGRAYIRTRRGEAVAAIREVEDVLRRERQKENPRLLWHAALVHAMAVGVLDADPKHNNSYRGAFLAQYRARGVELLRQALNLTPPEKQAEFWRTFVQPEAAFDSLARTPEYLELERKLTASAGGERGR